MIFHFIINVMWNYHAILIRILLFFRPSFRFRDVWKQRTWYVTDNILFVRVEYFGVDEFLVFFFCSSLFF